MIQWYPGHMAKAKREIQEKLKLVDIVYELVDARIPFSSINPDFEDILKNVNKLIIMTKADMADPVMLKKAIKIYEERGIMCVALNALNLNYSKDIIAKSKIILKEKIENALKKGLKPRAIRAMVIGIPNVGKSTLINGLCAKHVAKTGNHPGVTISQQWIRINSELELLDTPGVLWPKFESIEKSYKLALCGSIKDEVVHSDDMIMYFIDYLKKNYPNTISSRYGVDESLEFVPMLDAIAKSKGYIKGSFIDYEKVYEVLLADFRNLKMGRISLEDE